MGKEEENKKALYSIDDINNDWLFEHGAQRGADLGFKCLEEILSIKKPNTLYIMAPPAAGKCLGKGTKLVMFDGKYKNVEDVVVGDQLMGIDSTPRNVLSLARGMEEMYWIRQNHGMDYRVNKSHILSLRRSKSESHCTSDETRRHSLYNISVENYIDMPKTKKEGLKGWKTGVEMKEKKHTIEPYFLGLWLGDGIASDVGICNIYREFIEYQKHYAYRIGVNLAQYKYRKSEAPVWAITKGGNIKRKLGIMRLIKNKHIPDNYKYTSRKVRLELLAGMIDSDGSVSSATGYEITQKNERLIDDIIYLAHSLGYKASKNKKMASINGKRLKYWRTHLGGDVREIPVKIERKKLTAERVFKYTGINVEYDGVGDYYGFTLDGDKMFLLEDFTVTHNTEFLFEMLRNLSEFYNWRHAIFSPETGNEWEIKAELEQKRARKDFYDTYGKQMTEKQKLEADVWLNDHFWVVPSNARMSLAEFYEAIDREEQRVGQKFDTVTIDPWNKIYHDMNGARDDKYLEKALDEVDFNAQKHDRVNIIAQHCRDQKPIQGDFDDGGKHYYYPPPGPRDYAQGQVWFRTGKTMIGLWRPPSGLLKDDGTGPYKKNELVVAIHKAKPKGVAIPAPDTWEAILGYDTKLHSYYEPCTTFHDISEQEKHGINGNVYATKRIEYIQPAKPPPIWF